MFGAVLSAREKHEYHDMRLRLLAARVGVGGSGVFGGSEGGDPAEVVVLLRFRRSDNFF